MFANQFGYKLEQLNSAIDTAEKHLNDLQGRILTSQEKKALPTQKTLTGAIRDISGDDILMINYLSICLSLMI